MKIRNGFVSNSSSSSFIVFLPKRPKTQKECFQMLFPKGNPKQILSNDAGYCASTREEILTLKDAAGIVFKDIQRYVERPDVCPVGMVHPSEDDVVAKKVAALGPSPRWDESNPGPHEKYQEKYREILHQAFVDKHKDIYEKNKGAFMFCVEYEDHDCEGAQMERGDAFRNVPFIYISNH